MLKVRKQFLSLDRKEQYAEELRVGLRKSRPPSVPGFRKVDLPEIPCITTLDAGLFLNHRNSMNKVQSFETQCCAPGLILLRSKL